MSEQQTANNKLGVFTLIMVTTALFMTLRNMPMMAQTGLQMIFFNFITVFAFLIPVALVAAELATGWPKGGVYYWVRAAFGNNTGFMAIWLQWIQSIFGVTSILAYVGGSLAYVFDSSLGNSKYFITITITITIICVYWIATLLNFKGTKYSGIISSVALSAGVLFPTMLLIILSLIYVIADNPIVMNLTLSSEYLIPSFLNTLSLVLFLSFVFGFVGIEVSAGHAKDVINPKRNYSIALFSAAIIGFVLTLLGGFAIGVIIPANEIEPINGATQAFSALLQHFNMLWIIPIVAFLIAAGAAGQVSTWVVGPIKGLAAAGNDGNLPQYLQQENKVGVPTRILIIQAIFISLIGLLFLLVDNVSTMFLMLTSIAIILYAIMYIIMFAEAIYLRCSQPDVERAYKIPGGKPGIWLVSGIGTITIFTCLIIGFIPPSPNPFGFFDFELIITGLSITSIAIAVIILWSKNPKWMQKQID